MQRTVYHIAYFSHKRDTTHTEHPTHSHTHTYGVYGGQARTATV